MIQSKATQDMFIVNAKVVDPSSSFNGKKVDVLIQKGIITKIGKDLKEPFGSVRISGKNLIVSPGFVDLHTNVQDPGFEYKEDIHSALNAAASGGFTGILACSTTDPCIDNKSSVEYQQRKAAGQLTDLWVAGSISKKQKGQELAEMYDMHMAGAKAFYDFKSDVTDSQLLKLALLYTKPFNGVVMIHPSEHFLSSGGLVHEGIMSTVNGLHGIPEMAEEIGIQRALKIAEYTERPIHFTCISTLAGVELVKKAKKQGLQITCGVSSASLFYTDKVLENFDSNFKLNPPLRDEKTRKGLIEALSKGIIDVVVSDHWPQNVEGKECEFEVADFGMNSLETSFSMMTTAATGKLDDQKIVEIMALNPRKILNITAPSISEKNPANLTVFQLDEKWTFDVKKSHSNSRNTPKHPEFNGKIFAVINNEQVHINTQ